MLLRFDYTAKTYFFSSDFPVFFLHLLIFRMYIDTHAHLYFPSFEPDFQDVIDRMKKAKVDKVINIGVDLESSKKSIEMSRKFDGMYAAIGIHPTESSQWNDEILEMLRDLVLNAHEGNVHHCSDTENVRNTNRESDFKKNNNASKRMVVAIGEVGLDYYRLPSDDVQSKEFQKNVFRKQIRLARELHLPIIIHCRDAYEDTFRVLFEEGADKVVFHCFSGDLSFARKLWENGYYTSFTGIITYPNAHALREVVKAAPLDRIMVETDCPFLSPQSHRGKRNEPSFLPEIVKKIEEIKNRENLSESIFQNSEFFYQLS